jgi:inhibitor of cysteine peptidase
MGMGRKVKMKKQLVLLASVLLVLIFAAGCAKNMEVDEEMNGGSVVLEQGQTLVLKLASNPTTGYDWEIVDLNGAILEQVGEVDYKSDSALIGSGGVNTYTFKAVGSGNVKLSLVYHRSWEKDIPPIETFELDVTVK